MSATVQQFHEEEALKKFDRGSAWRLLRYLRPYRRLIVPALVLTLFVNALGVVEPKFFQYAIDWHIIPKQLSGLQWLALAFLGVKLLQMLVSYLQAVLLQSVGQYVMYDLRAELYAKLQRQEVAYFDRNPVGRVMTRLTSDVDALNELFTSGVIEGLGDVLMVFAIVGFMAWMDWRLPLVALVGHTGSGKTTITNLLMRFYDVQRGHVLLDGVDVREWDLKALRENFAVVLQDVFLFSGTVEGNIRLGREDVSDERVAWAAREVHADRFIDRLPEGFKAEVRERGAGL